MVPSGRITTYRFCHTKKNSPGIAPGLFGISLAAGWWLSVLASALDGPSGRQAGDEDTDADHAE